MRNPKPKLKNKLAPEVLDCREFLRGFGGKFYEEPKPCPLCGCEEHVKNGQINRLLCKLITDDGGFEDVWVEVQRFICKECGEPFSAGPFYPKCLYGSPVVDLCLYLAAANPYNRIENILIDFGIQIDRDTVREYAMKFEDRLEEYAGMKLMGETIGVNFVKALFECGTIEQLKEERGEEFFESCSDETYPAKKGAKKEMKKENRRREFEGKKKVPFPEAFCAAFSYIPSHGFYASSVIRDFDFNYLLAKVVLAPTQGVDWRVMDGHPSYQEFDHWNCLVHFFRNWVKGDEILKLLKDDLPHLVPDYLSKKYAEFQDEKIEDLKCERPELFDEEGKFKGSLTTNAMEGGNWRLKYELRTPYSVTKSISGRMNLIALRESLRTFKGGKPTESWAHENSNFELEDVMNIKLGNPQQTTYQLPTGREKSILEGYGKQIAGSIDQPVKV